MHPALATALTCIAAREDRAVTGLPPLSQTVDIEALTAVLESNPTATVRFEYEGYRVVLGPGSDAVTVIDRDR
ncbi:HalOD1 output domain-containing protein [Natrinema marinum]|uniref:HalOD1 output domain-containing protein n=1 Tax=Natrinema marinum TaxID=2961598 RepID=UPI0020C8658B|nr:HalOD1 output domain-containing protein [Natrinema marinum]